MKIKIRFKARDALFISGKYFLLDGNIYIERGTPTEMGDHQTMFEKLKKLKPEYTGYHFLYVPRGAVIMDDVTFKAIISGPEDLNNVQRTRLAREFQPKQWSWEYDAHYNLEYILMDIQIKGEELGWDEETIQAEKDYVTQFFGEQVQMFVGNKLPIFL